MRQVTLTGLFIVGVLVLSAADTTAQMGGTNSVTSEAWFSQPNVPLNGFITVVYYGKWSVNAKTWKADWVYTDRGQFVNGQWVSIQGSSVFNQLKVDAAARFNDYGTYGTASGNPVPQAGITVLTYQKGATVNVRAQLYAKPANNPNAQSVVVASSTQTLTMP